MTLGSLRLATNTLLLLLFSLWTRMLQIQIFHTSSKNSSFPWRYWRIFWCLHSDAMIHPLHLLLHLGHIDAPIVHSLFLNRLFYLIIFQFPSFHRFSIVRDRFLDPGFYYAIQKPSSNSLLTRFTMLRFHPIIFQS